MSCCLWAVCLYLLYGLIILVPAGGLAPLFLALGALAAIRRLHGLIRRMRRLTLTGAGIRSRVPLIASDLAFLVAVQHGGIQTKVELSRGNILGAILCLALVTPILSIVVRKTTIMLADHFFRN